MKTCTHGDGGKGKTWNTKKRRKTKTRISRKGKGREELREETKIISGYERGD